MRTCEYSNRGAKRYGPRPMDLWPNHLCADMRTLMTSSKMILLQDHFEPEYAQTRTVASVTTEPAKPATTPPMIWLSRPKRNGANMNTTCLSPGYARYAMNPSRNPANQMPKIAVALPMARTTLPSNL